MTTKHSVKRLLLAFVVAAACQGGVAARPRAHHAVSAALPSDITSYLERLTGCQHWAGEDATDGARAREIEAAAVKLGCDRLEDDETRLRARYKGRTEVRKALDAARAAGD